MTKKCARFLILVLVIFTGLTGCCGESADERRCAAELREAKFLTCGQKFELIGFAYVGTNLKEYKMTRLMRSGEQPETYMIQKPDGSSYSFAEQLCGSTEKPDEVTEEDGEAKPLPCGKKLISIGYSYVGTVLHSHHATRPMRPDEQPETHFVWLPDNIIRIIELACPEE